MLIVVQTSDVSLPSSRHQLLLLMYVHAVNLVQVSRGPFCIASICVPPPAQFIDPGICEGSGAGGIAGALLAVNRAQQVRWEAWWGKRACDWWGVFGWGWLVRHSVATWLTSREHRSYPATFLAREPGLRPVKVTTDEMLQHFTFHPLLSATGLIASLDLVAVYFNVPRVVCSSTMFTLWRSRRRL